MRVLVGLSGGLDSSYTAYLLKEAGYEVTGIHFSNGLVEDLANPTVEKVAQYLEIPLQHMNLKTQFQALLETVDIEMCHQLTPNICVKCAKDIKFGYVLQYALDNGFDYFATGHYVRIENGRVKKAVDETRDQSYGFSVIPKKSLQHVLAPIGHLRKVEMRQHALSIGLPFIRKESRGLCFTPLPFNQFYSQFTKYPIIKGNFAFGCDSIKPIPHQGQQLYTRGQKINLANGKGYFVDKKCENGDIVLTTRENIYQSQFTIGQLNWHLEPCDRELSLSKTYHVMIRYNADPIECWIHSLQENKLVIDVITPVYAPTAGQIGTLYEGDLLIVGGYLE